MRSICLGDEAAFSLLSLLRLLDPFASHGVDVVQKLLFLVVVLHFVAPADALAVYQDVWDGASPRLLLQGGLQAGPKGVGVDFDDVGSRGDEIGLEEDGFGLARVGTVGFGEDDD